VPGATSWEARARKAVVYLDVGPDLSAHVDDLKGNVLPLAIAVEEADQHTASAQGETHGAHAAAGACQWQVSTAEPDTLCSARALATRALATRELPNKLRVSNSKSRILRNPLMRVSQEAAVTGRTLLVAPLP